MLTNMGQFTYSKCKVAKVLHLHILARDFVDAQLLRCSHLVDHISISLIFQVNSMGPFLGDGIFSCIYFLQWF